MSGEITYDNGGIRIPAGKLHGELPNIETAFLQNRLSPDDFRHFWNRMKISMGNNLVCTKILVYLFLILIVAFAMFELMSRIIYLPVFIGYFVSFTILLIIFIINSAMMRKKLIIFIAQENSKFWSAKGLHLQLVGIGRRSYLEFRVAPSAVNGYQPPVQYPQPYFQGGMPDNYMQQQGDYYYAPDQQSNSAKPISLLYFHISSFSGLRTAAIPA